MTKTPSCVEFVYIFIMDLLTISYVAWDLSFLILDRDLVFCLEWFLGCVIFGLTLWILWSLLLFVFSLKFRLLRRSKNFVSTRLHSDLFVYYFISSNYFQIEYIWIYLLTALKISVQLPQPWKICYLSLKSSLCH